MASWDEDIICTDIYSSNGPEFWGGTGNPGVCMGDGYWNKIWRDGNSVGLDWQTLAQGTDTDLQNRTIWYERATEISYDWGTGQPAGSPSGFNNSVSVMSYGYWEAPETGYYEIYTKWDDWVYISFDAGQTLDFHETYKNKNWYSFSKYFQAGVKYPLFVLMHEGSGNMSVFLKYTLPSEAVLSLDDGILDNAHEFEAAEWSEMAEAPDPFETQQYSCSDNLFHVFVGDGISGTDREGQFLCGAAGGAGAAAIPLDPINDPYTPAKCCEHQYDRFVELNFGVGPSWFELDQERELPPFYFYYDWIPIDTPEETDWQNIIDGGPMRQEYEAAYIAAQENTGAGQNFENLRVYCCNGLIADPDYEGQGMVDFSVDEVDPNAPYVQSGTRSGNVQKRTFFNYPYNGTYGTYNYLDGNNSIEYESADGLPPEYDKFEGKDLYTTSVGNEINEAILESKILNSTRNPFNWQESELNIPKLEPLQFIGESKVTLNHINIKNRGVNSKINDVYFHLYIFSKAFFDPFNSDGSFKSYTDLVDGFRGKGPGGSTSNVARFFSQSGPNYGEGGAPGTGLFSNMTILVEFDMLNNGPDSDSGAIVTVPEDFHSKQYSGFDPIKSLIKTQTTDVDDPQYTDGGFTTIFQEDGSQNPIYIGIHMDGDQDTTFDRSRNETIAVYEINPEDLFESLGGPGKVTVLDFDGPTGQTYSTNQDRTAAFKCTDASFTINSAGGVSLHPDLGGTDENGLYYPPKEFLDYIYNVIPPYLSSDDKINTTVGLGSDAMDKLILNMDPTRQILTPISYYLGSGNQYIGNESHLWTGDMFQTTFEIVVQYMSGKFGNWMPVSDVKINTSGVDYDFQTYYENLDHRSVVSAPNTIHLDYYITPHPYPYGIQGPKGNKSEEDSSSPSGQTGWGFCRPIGWNQFGLVNGLADQPWLHTSGPANGDTIENNDGFELPDKAQADVVRYYGEFAKPHENHSSPLIEPVIADLPNFNDSNYVFFVVHWNDVDDMYQTIDDVMMEWPRTKSQLLRKRRDNLYIPNYVGNPIKHNYSTSGTKIIKTIMFNTDSRELDSMEPLRWKLITTKIFIDIPLTEFPDFGEVGGDDYTTIPWPYVTPVLGGVSEDSKYFKSIDDTLGSGKMGYGDTIDETFLIQSRKNDEIGTNIQKLDLEQARYFNKPYSMSDLLNISSTSAEGAPPNTTADFLWNLPFPLRGGEFNANQDNSIGTYPTWDGDDIVSGGDAYNWYLRGRPDIAYLMLNLNDQRDIDLHPTTEEPHGYHYPYYVRWWVDSDVGAFLDLFAMDNFGGYIQGLCDEVEEGTDGNCESHPMRYWWMLIGEELIRVQGMPTTITHEGYDGGSAYPYLRMIVYRGGTPQNSIGDYPVVPAYGHTADERVCVWSSKPTIEQVMSCIETNGIYPNGFPPPEINQYDQLSYLLFTTTTHADIINQQSNPSFGLYRAENNMIIFSHNSANGNYTGPEVQDIRNIRMFNDESFLYNTIDDYPMRDIESFYSPEYTPPEWHPYSDMSGSMTQTNGYWDGHINKFPEESSVGQIFISDNLDSDLVNSCKFEFNTGELEKKSLRDTSGGGNKGMLIGDYKITKTQKNKSMRRDSFVKIPKKNNNLDGAM